MHFLAAATFGWLAKAKSTPKIDAHPRSRSLQFTRRRNNHPSINMCLIIVMVSSACFLIVSHMTLLFDRNTTRFSWTLTTRMGPPVAQRLRPSSNFDRIEHPDNGLLYEERPPGKFPVGGRHIIAHGLSRTASTLLFNMVGVSNFLHLKRHEPQFMSHIEPQYIKEEKEGDRKYEHYFRVNPTITTKIFKTHIDLEKFLKYDAIIFTTTKTKRQAATIKSSLEKEGHDVAYVQDMETLKRGGIPRIAQDFAFGYDLPKEDEEKLVEYFSQWELLRQCCGEQMSKNWRNDLLPEVYKKDKMAHHRFCADHDIDEIEKAFMETELYSWLDAYPNMRPFNKPSLRDGDLNGTYCSSYNERVKTEALNFYGQPRPVETINTGDWTEQEHSIFLEGLKLYGSNQPKKIAKMIETRTEMQVVKHFNAYIKTLLQKEVIDEVPKRPAHKGNDTQVTLPWLNMTREAN